MYRDIIVNDRGAKNGEAGRTPCLVVDPLLEVTQQLTIPTEDSAPAFSEKFHAALTLELLPHLQRPPVPLRPLLRRLEVQDPCDAPAVIMVIAFCVSTSGDSVLREHVW